MVGFVTALGVWALDLALQPDHMHDDHCAGRTSYILLEPTPREAFDDHKETAGLIDRGTVVTRMKCLALSLCARLVTASPCAMLSSSSSSAGALSCDISWERYITFTGPGGTHLPPMLEVHTPSLLAANSTWMPADVPADAERISTFDAYDPSNPTADFDAEHAQAQAVLRSGRPFVWKLSWHYPRQAQKEMVDTLKPALETLVVPGGLAGKMSRRLGVVPGYGDATLALREALFRRAGATAGKYLTLHLRRGDALSQCDTTIPTVVSFVECELRNEGRFHTHSESLLLFTDEADPTYLRDVVGNLSALWQGQRTVLHADPLISDLSDDADNFLIFNIGLAVMEEAVSALEIRDKTHSNDGGSMCTGTCTPLAGGKPASPPLSQFRRLDWRCQGGYGG
jgi:hypothetical protein